MIAIGLYFLLKPNISDESRAARITPPLFAATAVPAIGFYDGIFGPGTGSFFMLAFVMLAGHGLLESNRPHQNTQFRLQHRRFHHLRRMQAPSTGKPASSWAPHSFSARARARILP